jgi:hypothetical protein
MQRNARLRSVTIILSPEDQRLLAEADAFEDAAEAVLIGAVTHGEPPPPDAAWGAAAMLRKARLYRRAVGLREVA